MAEADSDELAPPPSARGVAWGIYGLVAAVIVAIDLGVKQWTTANLAHNEPAVKLFGGLIYVIYTRNSGAAFSMLRDQTWIFPIIALVVIGWLMYMIRTTRSIGWAVAFGLIFGGAAGNLGDRLFRAPGPFQGHVVDMFSFLDDHGGHFPVFNIADSALTVGVALGVLLEFAGRRRDGLRPRPAPAVTEAAPGVAAEGTRDERA